MPVTWIRHEGERIIHTDFRGCKSEAEMLALFDKAVGEVLAAPGLVLTNARAFDSEAAVLAYLVSKK